MRNDLTSIEIPFSSIKEELDLETFIRTCIISGIKRERLILITQGARHSPSYGHDVRVAHSISRSQIIASF